VLGKIFGNGVTVFRGGYGIAYDFLFYNILTVNGSNFPRVVSLQAQQADLVTSSRTSSAVRRRHSIR